MPKTKTLKGVIEFKYVDKDGHERVRMLAAPIVREGTDTGGPGFGLYRALVDYFPQGSPTLWFDLMDEKQQREWITAGLMQGACPIFGYPNFDAGEGINVHHDTREGMGQKDLAQAPWNMIPALVSSDPARNAHEMYHQMTIDKQGFKIEHWDPLDEENGFDVSDPEGDLLPHDDLWYYTRPTDSRVKLAIEWLDGSKKLNKSLVEAAYFLGALAAQGDDHARLLGFGTVKGCYAQHGISNDLPEMLGKLYAGLTDDYEQCRDQLIIPAAADLYRKKLKKQSDELKVEWWQKLVDMCSPLSAHPSFGAFAQLLRLRFPRKVRAQIITCVDGDDFELTEETAVDPKELAAAGRTVFLGRPVKAKEEGPTSPAPLFDDEEEDDEVENENTEPSADDQP
jgi:hypothetical protein